MKKTYIKPDFQAFEITPLEIMAGSNWDNGNHGHDNGNHNGWNNEHNPHYRNQLWGSDD